MNWLNSSRLLQAQSHSSSRWDRTCFTPRRIFPGAEYIGPASSESGLQSLRKRAEPLPRDKFIVIYCGCCPWSHCPNIKPADDALRAMGFTNVKVLYIADNFGANWVDKGYPTAKGD
jgi:hypothetical protein